MRSLDWHSTLVECGATPIPSERWRLIKGFEKFYAVSDHGRVLSFTVKREHGGYRPRVYPGRLLRVSTTQRPSVTLWCDFESRKVRVYVLVAEHFIPNFEGHPFVCHKDDDCQNNHWRNLYWGTSADNTNDKCRNGNAARKLTLEAVQQMRRDLASARRTTTRLAPGELESIALRYGVSKATVCKIHLRKEWKHA